MWPFKKKTQTRSAPLSVVITPGGGLLPSAVMTGADVDAVYEASVWAYAAIHGAAQLLAGLPPVVETRAPGGTWVRADASHPAWALIMSPMGRESAYPAMSWSEWIYMVAVQRYVCGNAYIVPTYVDAGRRIYSLLPLLRPTQMRADEDARGIPTTFFYGDLKYAPEQIVVIRFPRPGSLWRGLSPLRVALGDVTTDNYAEKRLQAHLSNKIAPGLILSIDSPLGPTEEQRERLYRELAEGYQQAEHTGKPWVIGGHVDLLDAPKANEIEYFEVRKHCREAILTAIGVHPAVAVSLGEKLNIGYEHALRQYHQSYILPQAEQIYGALTQHAIRRAYGDDVRITYDITGSEVALLLLSQKLDVARKLLALGYPTNAINERLSLGMPEHPALNVPNVGFIQAGRLPDIADYIEGLGKLENL